MASFPYGKEIFFRQCQGDLSKLARACEEHMMWRKIIYDNSMEYWLQNLILRLIRCLLPLTMHVCCMCEGVESEFVLSEAHKKLNNTCQTAFTRCRHEKITTKFSCVHTKALHVSKSSLKPQIFQGYCFEIREVGR